MGRHAAPKQQRPEVRGRHRKPTESVGLRERILGRTSRRVGAAALVAAVSWNSGQALSDRNSPEITAAPPAAEVVAKGKSDTSRQLGSMSLLKKWSRSVDRKPIQEDTLELQAKKVESDPRPARNYERAYHQGKLFDKYTVELLKRFEEGMYEAGVPFTYYTQGSYTRGNASSGDTHAGGGAVDYSINAYGGPYSKGALNALREFRKAGFAAWIRLPGEAGKAAHIHAVAIGNETADYTAKEQVSAYLNGRNGLLNNAPDRYAESVGQPLPQWAEDIKPQLQ